MLLNALEVFLNFFNPMKIALLLSFICPLLYLSINSQILEADTSLARIKKNLPAKFMSENTDIYFISTKDGYLHALNNNLKEMWKVYLEQELMSSTISTRKIDDNLILYPINERLYINKNGDFIPFDIFIKDLVKRQFFQFNEAAAYLGKTKTTLFIIDVDTGEILQKIDDDFSFKKRYIMRKKNTINVVRVDYILNCMGIGDEQKVWNASYSDIIIQKGNLIQDDSHFFRSFNFLESIISEYRRVNNIENDYSEINNDNVITAYSYFNRDISPIKIYDRSLSKNYSYDNELNGIKREIQNLIDYSEEKSEKNKKDDNIKKNISFLRKILDNLVYVSNLITNRYILIAYIIIFSYKLRWNKFLYSITIEKYLQKEINQNIKNNNNSDGIGNHIHTHIYTNEHKYAQDDHVHENNIILNKVLEKRPYGNYSQYKK